MNPEEDIHTFCETIVSVRRGHTPEGFSYSCIEDFLLNRGKFWTPAPLPKTVKRMPPKECFFNVLKLVQRRHGKLRYVEGLAMGIIPVHHSWAVDLQGTVIDPTWETPGTAYFGVVFDVGERLLAEGPILSDYRRGFPVFRWPRMKAVTHGR